jgi:SepF-like predicted cell division protein (DUF552 family)
MAFGRIFGKGSETKDSDDYIQLTEITEDKRKKMLVQIEKITEYADSDRVQRKLREGNILLVKVKELREKDVGELKRAISRIKKTCTAINGDIAGVGDDWLICTPEGVRVYREG